MNRFDRLTYTDKIKWRIRILWALLIGMLIYMVAAGELAGDSRKMTDFANTAGDLIFFGGLAYVICSIIRNKRLLKNRLLLKEQMQIEQDERNQYLHDKSGGVVMDVLLVMLLFAVMTASLVDMAAFYFTAGLLAAAVLLKWAAYWVFSR